MKKKKPVWIVIVKVLPALRRRIVKRFRGCKNHEHALRRAAIWLDEDDGVLSYLVMRVSCKAIGYEWVAS